MKNKDKTIAIKEFDVFSEGRRSNRPVPPAICNFLVSMHSLNNIT